MVRLCSAGHALHTLPKHSKIFGKRTAHSHKVWHITASDTSRCHPTSAMLPFEPDIYIPSSYINAVRPRWLNEQAGPQLNLGFEESQAPGGNLWVHSPARMWHLLCAPRQKGHWARLRTTSNWVHFSREAHNKAYMWNLKLAALSKVCITV